MNRYKLIIAVLAIAIVILGVPRLLLVPYLEREFESELAASLQASEARVEVQTPWGWELLWDASHAWILPPLMPLSTA